MEYGVTKIGTNIVLFLDPEAADTVSRGLIELGWAEMSTARASRLQDLADFSEAIDEILDKND